MSKRATNVRSPIRSLLPACCLLAIPLWIAGCDDEPASRPTPTATPTVSAETLRTVADSYLAEAESATKKITDDETRDTVLRALAGSLTIAGKPDLARKQIASMQSETKRTASARVVASVQAAKDWKHWQPTIKEPTDTEKNRRKHRSVEELTKRPELPEVSESDRLHRREVDKRIAAKDLAGAFKEAQQITEPNNKVIALLRIYQRYLLALQGDQGKPLLDAAVVAAAGDPIILRDIATVAAGPFGNARDSDSDVTSGNFPEALRIASIIKDEKVRNQAYSNIGILQASHFDFEGAEKSAEKITDIATRSGMRSDIVDGLVQKQNFSLAEGILNKIEVALDRDEALESIIVGYLGAKKAKEAEAATERMQDPYPQCQSYRTIARAQWKDFSDTTGARQTLQKAFASAKKVPDNTTDPAFNRSHWRDQSLSLTAILQTSVGDFDSAKVSASAIQDAKRKAQTFIQLADVLLIPKDSP